MEHPDQLTEVGEDNSLQDDTECEFEESVDGIEDLEIQLERNLAALFLKMLTILHISESAAQEDADSDEAWAQVSVGVLTVISEDVPLCPNHLHLDTVSTAIIVEGGIVMDNLENLPQAMCLLFGLSYVLHLDYPKATKNTFNFM
ncbi:hypothetical protein MHYP_G00056230 [Metynnis hypsauchen]